MAKNLTCLNVFMASLGGLDKERKVFRDVVEACNHSDAKPRGVCLNPVGWEDTLGGIGRPQSLINEDARAADFFVLMLWDRWGSPPDAGSSRFGSGTEEEYHVTLECLAADEQPMRQMVLFFKAVDFKQLADAGPQLTKVLDFKKEIEQEKKLLYQTFDAEDRFRTLLQRHLADWLLREEKGGDHKTDIEEPPAPSDRQAFETSSAAAREEDVTEVAPTSSTAKAWELANEGRLTEAEIEFARAVVGRRAPEAFVDYGRFLNRVGRLDQAKMLFEEAIEVATSQKDEAILPKACRNLGNVLHTRGDLDGAERMYRKALEVDERLRQLEDMPDDYRNLGNVFHTRGDLDGAEAM